MRWRLLILLMLAPILVRAQSGTPLKRIQVQGGGPVVIEGDVERGKEVFFVFRAKAGAKFSGQLATKSGKAGFAVDDADGRGLPEEELDFNTNLTSSLEKTGDYTITVATFDRRRVHFTLTVRIY